MAAGRPTEYKSEYVQLVEEYITSCGREQTKLPKRVDIALLLGCTEDTLANWGKDNPEFLGALTRVDMTQKGQLMDDGMYGGKEVNSQIAKFLLSANHGLTETIREEHTGKDGQPLQLLVNAGSGFLPPTVTLPAASASSLAAGQSPIQGVGVASESQEDNHSDIGTSQTGTS